MFVWCGIVKKNFKWIDIFYFLLRLSDFCLIYYTMFDLDCAKEDIKSQCKQQNTPSNYNGIECWLLSFSFFVHIVFHSKWISIGRYYRKEVVQKRRAKSRKKRKKFRKFELLERWDYNKKITFCITALSCSMFNVRIDKHEIWIKYEMCVLCTMQSVGRHDFFSTIKLLHCELTRKERYRYIICIKEKPQIFLRQKLNLIIFFNSTQQHLTVLILIFRLHPKVPSPYLFVSTFSPTKYCQLLECHLFTMTWFMISS